MITATYAKLKNGTWGVRASASVRDGDTIAVAKKSGETKPEKIAKVLWRGDGVALCAIAQSGAARYSAGGRRRRNEDDECELCGKNKYTCGHCIGW